MSIQGTETEIENAGGSGVESDGHESLDYTYLHLGKESTDAK